MLLVYYFNILDESLINDNRHSREVFSFIILEKHNLNFYCVERPIEFG